MDKKDYISNIFRKILKEDLEEKAESLMNKLDRNKKTNLYNDNEFDYVEENKSMCESCGGEMIEGEMCESCGNTYAGDMGEGVNFEIDERLYGNQSRIDKNKNNRKLQLCRRSQLS